MGYFVDKCNCNRRTLWSRMQQSCYLFSNYFYCSSANIYSSSTKYYHYSEVWFIYYGVIKRQVWFLRSELKALPCSVLWPTSGHTWRQQWQCYYHFRCVADEQRTLALGVQSVAFRAFGSIPGPIIFGAIFDSACIYWQYECSRRGNCWVYNNVHLSQRAVSLAMLGIGTNFIFSILCWLFYPKKKATNDSAVSGHDGSIEMKDRSDVAVESERNWQS